MGDYLEARKRTNTELGRLNSGIEKERIWQRDNFTIGAVIPASARKEISSPAPAEDCLPILIDWPFAADENGIPFDQANLYGMSYQAPAHDDDYKDFIPLPKTVPAGYTLLHPRHGVYGHNSPAQLFEQIRTPTGVFNRFGLTQAKYNCKPRADVRASPPLADPGVGTEFDFAAGANVMAGPYTGGHAGFVSPALPGVRGCKYTFRGESVRQNPYPTPPDYGGWVRLSFLFDADPENPWNPATNANPPTLLFSVEGTNGTTVVSGTSTAQALARPGWTGGVWGVLQSQYNDADDYVISGFSLRWARTTQVPWCHTIVCGNKISPGGLIDGGH